MWGTTCISLRSLNQQIHPLHRTTETSARDPGQKCVSRESNAGPIDGNDGFYH
ncbi:hypothetical protein N657DRAFT_642571 [Parathielavia appendiculata]|uniref:Uncharacterized protein n=1 Tax=Parathielavia appendiculata TaxID=2587402 RepID=A0AAN6U3J5_9PEZI|nr:hypothetical protein N657DRAFT_642571 [Parathielavia appendiculata]